MSNVLGAESIWRCHLTSIGNNFVEIRRSYDRLISTMGFPILVRRHIYIESGPWLSEWKFGFRLTVPIFSKFPAIHTHITQKTKYWMPFLTWWRHYMETFFALLALCGWIHQAPVDFPHKGQWREALMFFLICAWTNDWANNRDGGNLRCHHALYGVAVMSSDCDQSSTKRNLYSLY